MLVCQRRQGLKQRASPTINVTQEGAARPLPRGPFDNETVLRMCESITKANGCNEGGGIWVKAKQLFAYLPLLV